jgi:Fe-S oxidoreductase
MGLDDVAEWLHYCPRCNSCKFLYRNYSASCPAFEKFRWESYTASGKVWLARDLYERKYPISKSIRDIIFSCTMCGNCSEQCQQEISNHHLDIYEALREECVNSGLSLPAHQIFHQNIDETHNPYGEAHDSRFDGIDAKYFKSQAEVYLFVGCTTAYRNKELLQDIIAILDHLGVDFTLSHDEWCCGSPLFTTGQKQFARTVAEHNTDVIKQIGAKFVITACAGCYRSLKQQYPAKFGLLKSLDHPSSNKNSPLPQILHISQFLNQRIPKKLFVESKPIRVTYHDPCHLGRHMGIFEEPREIIHKMKHVELVEMPRNRQNAWCCGAGAGVKSAYKDWAIEIAEQRIQEALDLQTDGKGLISYIVSTCPFCDRNLGDAITSLRQKGKSGADSIELIDLAHLIRQRMKI